MLGNDDAAINDADQVRQLLDFDDPAGSVGNAVKVSANRDEAIMGHPPLELQDGVEAMVGEPLQLLLFLG